MRRYTTAALALLLNATFFVSGSVQSAALHSYRCDDCPELSKAPLETQWKIKKNPELFAKEKSSTESRTWKKRVAGADLVEGIAFETLAPGAILRLSVHSKMALAANWSEQLVVQLPDGRVTSLHRLGLVTDKHLIPKDSALQQSMIIALDPSLGFGRFTIQLQPKASFALQSDWELVVNDTFASLALHVETDKFRYRYGDELVATVYLRDERRHYPVDNLEGSVRLPSGNTQQIDFQKIKRNVYQGRLWLKEQDIARGANWDLDVLSEQINDNGTIFRTAHTSFSYTVPSAKVESIATHKNAKNQYQANIRTVQPARYTFQAAVYGYDAIGEYRPIQMVQSSAWLEKGEGSIPFTLNINLLKGTKGPYALGEITLMDLTQLKPVFYDKRLTELNE